MIIDTSQRLRPPPVRKQEPTDNIHLPQLHRPVPRPPLPLPIPRTPASRINQPEPQQRSIRPGLGRHRLHARPRKLNRNRCYPSTESLSPITRMPNGTNQAK